MKETRLAWKVVRKSRRAYVSCMESTPLARVIYCKGKKANRRKNMGPLAGFDTRRNARYFMKYHSAGTESVLFRCEAELSDDICLWDEYRTLPAHVLCPGTLYCDSIKLLWRAE